MLNFIKNIFFIIHILKELNCDLEKSLKQLLSLSPKFNKNYNFEFNDDFRKNSKIDGSENIFEETFNKIILLQPVCFIEAFECYEKEVNYIFPKKL